MIGNVHSTTLFCMAITLINSFLVNLGINFFGSGVGSGGDCCNLDNDTFPITFYNINI
mgnify:CR=1 FL=1